MTASYELTLCHQYEGHATIFQPPNTLAFSTEAHKPRLRRENNSMAINLEQVGQLSGAVSSRVISSIFETARPHCFTIPANPTTPQRGRHQMVRTVLVRRHRHTHMSSG